MTRQDAEELRLLVRRAELESEARRMGCRVDDPEAFRGWRSEIAWTFAVLTVLVAGLAFAAGVTLA